MRVLDCAYALGQERDDVLEIVALVLRDALLERQAGAGAEASPAAPEEEGRRR